MIRTIKENYYTAIKMNLDQVVMCVFGGMMSLSGAATGKDSIVVLLSLFSILFYLYLLYAMFYEIGQKDGIRINAQRLAYDKFKAFWIALFANSLNFLLGICTVVFKALIKGVSMTQNLAELSHDAASAVGPSWAVSAYETCHTIAKAIQCMYVGVLRVFFSGNVYALLFTPIPAIIVSVVAYKLGVKYCDGFINRKNKSERYKV